MKIPGVRLILPLLAVVVLAWVWREPLRRQIFKSAILANDAPPNENVADMIDQAVNPPEALLAAWHSGKIIQREVALQELRRRFPATQTLPPPMESLLLAAALDPDMNVRETALGILREHHHPALTALAAAQLNDPDEQLRLLGLYHLKSATPATGVPLAAALLSDPDLAVRGMSVKLLEQWSGETFGIKLSDTVPVENPTNGLSEFPADGIAKTEAAAAKARSWWAVHQKEFPPVKPTVPADAGLEPLPAGDFELHRLDGKKVRLTDFRGKVVLINFWTTWCPACVGEMPELIALQNRHSNDLVILGVSLDFVPDDDGDHPPDPGQIPQTVARIVKTRGLNYPVFLDEHNEVGGRFNGGELPTTVLVDARGNVRRRFVGTRSLPVFEAMLAEAGQPPKPAAR